MAASVRTFAVNIVPRLNINLLPLSLVSGLHRHAPQRCLQILSLNQLIARHARPFSRSLHGEHSNQISLGKEDSLSSVCSKLGRLSLAHVRSFSGLAPIACGHRGVAYGQKSTTQLNSTCTSQVLTRPPRRTVIRYSKEKGKKKTTKAVVARFYRLSNGLWVRTQAGRAKKLWKKSSRRRNRLKQHVFCNKTQSKMLDRMVCKYWKKRRYYPDDPFEKYQERNYNGYKMWLGQKHARNSDV